MTNGAPNTQDQDDARQPAEAGEEITEASAKTQADVRSAEEMLVQKLLGVDLRAVGAERGPAIVAGRIAARIASILIETRRQITDDFRSTLQQRLAQLGYEAGIDPRMRAQIVLQAVRETFPTEVVRELVERLWPTVYRADKTDYPVDTSPSDLVLGNVTLGGTTHRVIVDTDHPLWKQTSSDQLADYLEGRTLSGCGIRVIPDNIGRGYMLTAPEAQSILTEVSTMIYTLDASTEDPTINNYNSATGTVRGYTVRLKLRHLLAREMQDAGQEFPDAAALDSFLNNADNWERFVEVIPTRTASPARPSYSDAALRAKLADRAFQLLTQTPLGRAGMALQDVARHQHALHHFSNKLRKGEVNPWDVATAMTMIQQQGELADALTGTEQKEEVQKVVDRLNMLRNLETIKTSIDIPSVPSVAGVTWNLESLEKELNDLVRDAEEWRNGNHAHRDSHFAKRMAPSSQKSAARQVPSLDQRREELLPAIKAMRKAEPMLKQIAVVVHASQVPASEVPLLDQVVDISANPAVKPTAFSPSTNLVAIADEVRKAIPNLKSEEQYRDELKKLQEKSAKAPEGADAVHAIYRNYFKGRGLSERESRNAANELMARNALDTEMEAIVGDATRSAYPVERNVPGGMGAQWSERFVHGLRGLERSGSRIRNSVNAVASAFAIPLRNGRPDVNGANPEQLIRFYYALKRLVGGGSKMGLPEYDANAQGYLRSVGGVLTRRHAKALLYMFKGSLPADVGQDDKAVETILGQPEKLKTILAQLLRGDPPPAYQDAIQKGLQRAESQFEWKRRMFFIDRLVGEKWSAKQAIASKDFPLSLRNIYFGKWGILGLPWRMLRGTPAAAKATGGAVWRERKGIALWAIIGTLFLPGVGTAIGAAAGAGWRKFAE